MAKCKIISSDNLKCLKREIIEQIDQAQIQAEMYREEFEQQQKTQQKEKIVEKLQQNINSWDDKRSNFHQCLVLIERFSSEIEI